MRLFLEELEAIRLAAFEAILRMVSERDSCEPVRGDPNVGISQLKEVIRKAQDHPDPKIRELAGSHPSSPNFPGGGLF